MPCIAYELVLFCAFYNDIRCITFGHYDAVRQVAFWVWLLLSLKFRFWGKRYGAPLPL